MAVDVPMYEVNIHLLNLVETQQKISDTLVRIADNMEVQNRQYIVTPVWERDSAQKPKEEKPKEEKPKEEKPKEEKPKEEKPKEEKPKEETITRKDLFSIFAKLVNTGRKPILVATLKKYGVQQLAKIPEEAYRDVYDIAKKGLADG